MTLSIVIPIYNAQAYIDHCLCSIDDTEVGDVEIICVNDGSTDETLSILRKWAEKDARIILIDQENQGTMVARKVGTIAAKGDYVTFIDPDDWFITGAIKTILETTQEYGDDILMYGTKAVNVGGNAKRLVREFEMRQNTFPDYIDGNVQMIEECFDKRNIEWNIWGKVYRRELIKQAFSLLPDTKCVYAEDRYTTFVIFTFAKSFRGIRESLWNYSFGLGISSRKKMSINDYKLMVESLEMSEWTLDFARMYFPKDSVIISWINRMFKNLILEVISLHRRIEGLKSFNDVAGIITHGKSSQYATWVYGEVIKNLEREKDYIAKKNIKHLKILRIESMVLVFLLLIILYWLIG